MPITVHNQQGVFENPRVFTFPGGEVGVGLNAQNLRFLESENFYIRAAIKNSVDVMTLLLVTDALRRLTNKPVWLALFYVPYARQDRVCNKGESHSIKVFCNLINSLKYHRVIIADPHSEVTPALLDNCDILSQLDIISKWPDFAQPMYETDTIFVSPDAGSNKKVSTIAKYFNHTGFIRADKKRDLQTGNILETIVYADSLKGKRCVIIDDICDGGRTFIELAKVLKAKEAAMVELYVTHGIFSQGIDALATKGIDHIWTTNSLYEGEDNKNVSIFKLENLF